MFFLVFITKKANADAVLFFSFVIISNCDGKFYGIRIKFSCQILVNLSNF